MGVFSSSSKWDAVKDMPDLRGKVIIVTGGNTGIGYASVKQFVRGGAKVYLGARSEAKANDAIARLHDELGQELRGSVEYLHVDLSDPKLAKEAAEGFLAREGRLDVLLNNAAMTVVDYKRTLYDIQDIMVVNHLSPFVFTMTLLPLMKQTVDLPNADVRIVNVASQAIGYLKDTVRFRNREDFNDEHVGSFSAMTRYGRSKLANILFIKALQRRLDAEGSKVIAISLHPGTVQTDGNVRVAQSMQNAVARNVFTFMFKHLVTPVDKGAYTQVFASVAPEVRQHAELYKGAYLAPPAVISKPTKPGESPELAEELWNTTEGLLAEIGLTL
ncbi:hypothetical protein EIP91_002664 [Steccherinum ochraceum]|uniref:Uncharacterized protein n=1 Tax=Steccherinum ochraceum TaxID=92696 RepID=A0A4R0RBV4_9APHY|nr:hypothetical protein EIP91_002664 [Steccherinum ochraceum]